MTPINLRLERQCVVKGSLFDTMDAAYLIDDMLEVDLPSGDTVSVEWDGDSGPQGRFALVVFRDYWENRRSIQYATSPQEVVNRLRLLAWSASQTACSSSNGSSCIATPSNPSSDMDVAYWAPDDGRSRLESLQAMTNA